MMQETGKFIVMKCPKCGFENIFNQPFIYHAGFSNVGFLYNEVGNRTLIWSSFDPDYRVVAGERHPWTLTVELQRKIETLLQPDVGGRWLFDNPARCLRCHHPISEPMVNNIRFLVYDGSIDLDRARDPGRGIREVLKDRSEQ